MGWRCSSPAGGISDIENVVRLLHPERVMRRPIEPTTGPTIDGGGTLVPSQCTLSGFVEDVGNSDGMLMRDIEPLATLLVRTENSVYRIIPLEAGSSRILIHGG